MPGTSTITATPTLVRLDWESEHFGLSVAQISQADVNDAALCEILRQAREVGVRLTVWPTRQGREVSAEIISQFAGTLVDRKATFTRSLGGSLAFDMAADTSERPRRMFSRTPRVHRLRRSRS